MLPNWKSFFSYISLRRPIWLHSWHFYHIPCNQGTQGTPTPLLEALVLKGAIGNLCFTELTLWKIEFHGLVWLFGKIRKSQSRAWLSNTGNRSARCHFKAATHACISLLRMRTHILSVVLRLKLTKKKWSSRGLTGRNGSSAFAIQ